MTSNSIYDQHDKSFNSVSAFVIVDGSNKTATRVATVAIKFPRDGAGRLYAYVHWMGEPMVRGWAGGGGYDKRSAAVACAARRMPPLSVVAKYDDGTPHHTDAEQARYNAFCAACSDDNGNDWVRRLELAGFTVWQAV